MKFIFIDAEKCFVSDVPPNEWRLMTLKLVNGNNDFYNPFGGYLETETFTRKTAVISGVKWDVFVSNALDDKTSFEKLINYLPNTFRAER